MKFLKAFSSLFIIYILLFSTGSQLTSCSKKSVVDSADDINNGLVAYYNFTAGSLKDGSGHGNDIVFNSATKTTDRFGNANGAYQFDGSSSYMRVTNNPSVNPNNITLMAVVKIGGFNTGTCHANEIIGKGSPDNIDGFYALRFADADACSASIDSANQNFVGVYGDDIPQGTSAGATATGFPVAKATWYTVIYTFDGTVSNIYINGVLKSSLVKGATFAANTHDLLIGRHDDTTYPYWFKGVIDEVRIYNRALPIGAINTLSTLKN